MCRELTKLHEEVVRGTARELAQRFADGRGARSCWWSGPAGEAPSEAAPALEAVEELVEAGARRRAAAKIVSGLTGIPANRLYRA